MTNELKEINLKYFQNYFATYRQNMKEVSSGIKSIISHKSYNTPPISNIMDKMAKSCPNLLKSLTYLMNIL